MSAAWLNAKALLVALLVSAPLAWAGIAGAQSPHDLGGSPQGVRDVPSGDGTLQGVVRHRSGPGKTGGLPIVLYALDADGTPSLRNTTTDAGGAFRFENITSASGVTYLIGARYRDIPYGQRVSFQPAEAGHPAAKVIDVVLEVADPTADSSAVSVVESRLEVGWMGASLAISETHVLLNRGDAVVYVEPAARQSATPAFIAHLPEAASNFTVAFGSLASEFEQAPGGELRYWGSIHPGEQRVSYRYLLPAAGENTIFEPRFPSGSQAVTILVSADDPEASVTGAVPGEEIEFEGQRFRTFVAGPLERGDRVTLRLQAPELRDNPGALEIKLANVWLELDDTALTVMVEYTLSVPPMGRLVGSSQSPLLEIALPPGAELLGLSPNASRLGLQRARAGGAGREVGAEQLQLLGPIPAGLTQLSYRYRVPAGRTGSGTQIDLRFPRLLPQLNVMIADTGLVVEDERMHRRRPSRVGTRLYLQREAFQVLPDETISLRLTPLDRRRLTPWLALAPVVVGAMLAAWFVVAPLRSSGGLPRTARNELSTRERRESIYDAIRDLDHDFETGKVSEADHAEMRGELRRQAVEFMRQEKGGAPASREPAASEPSFTDATHAAHAAQAAPAVAVEGLARFCPACGQRAQPSWNFCGRCGDTLPSLSLPADAEA